MIYTSFLKSAFHVFHGPTPELPPDDGHAGLILVADGIGGLDLCGTGLTHAAAKAGVPHRVKVVPWGHGLGHWHRDLTNVQNHRTQAAAIVAQVKAFRAERPHSPVFLVGKSGGTGVAVRALEGLPDNSIEAAVLLSSALSPKYNLSQALRAVRREMVVFWSPLDVIILGAGTSIFGTIDRVHKVSAGLVGFRQPSGLDEDGRLQYEKLRQIRWSPKMARTGHLGGHIGPDGPAFLRKYVVPLLRVTEEVAIP